MTSASETMAEALRLTREGRLGEATTRLRALVGGSAPTQPLAPAAAAKPGAVIDMVPPPAGEAGAWREPDAAPPPQASFVPPTVGLDGLLKVKVPGVLKELAERIGRATSESGSAGECTQPVLPDGAQFLEQTIATPGGQRRYKLYIPSRSGGEPRPLVIMLHGCTQSPDDFAAGTQMNRVAEKQGCLVAYPAQTNAANPSKCWNWFQPQDQRRDEGEPALVAAITRQIMRDHSVDAGRIYIAGLSAGGAAAANIAALYPEIFAAIGIHSGLACGAASDLPSAMSAMKNGSPGKPSGRDRPHTPVIVFHGDGDHVVNPVNARHVIESAAGSAAAPRIEADAGRSPGGRSYTIARHVDAQGKVALEQWTIHGAGHAWAGGSSAGSYTDPAGPDASREMMRFFLAHRLH